MQHELKASLHYDLNNPVDANNYNSVKNLDATFQAIRNFNTALGDGIKTDLKELTEKLKTSLFEKPDKSPKQSVNNIEKFLDEVVELLKARYKDIMSKGGVMIN